MDQQNRSNNPLSGSLLRAADSRLRVVGRDKALARMEGWLEKTLGGERQL